MRPTKLRFRGLTCFGGEVEIDYDALGEGLVAFDGPNGSGKTSAMEALPAALWRGFPSRPSFYEYFHGKDAYIIAEFDDHGEDIGVRLLIDAEKRKTECYIAVNGESLTRTSLEYKEKVEQLFGSFDLFLASVFSCQTRKGNFLLMPKSQRKQLFIELLGLGHLEDLYAAAREHAFEADRKLRYAKEQVAGLEGKKENLAAHRRVLNDAQAAAAAARNARGAARDRVTEARKALGAAEERERRRVELSNKAERIEAGIAKLNSQIETSEAVAKAEVADVRAKVPLDHVAKTRAKYDEQINDWCDKRPSAGKRKEIERSGQKEVAGLTEELVGHTALAARRGEYNDAKAVAGQISEVLLMLDNADATYQLKEQTVTALRIRHDEMVALRDNEREGLTRTARIAKDVPCHPGPWLDSQADQSPSDLAGTCPLLADARDADKKLAGMLDWIYPATGETLGEVGDLLKKAEAELEELGKLKRKNDERRRTLTQQLSGFDRILALNNEITLAEGRGAEVAKRIEDSRQRLADYLQAFDESDTEWGAHKDKLFRRKEVEVEVARGEVIIANDAVNRIESAHGRLVERITKLTAGLHRDREKLLVPPSNDCHMSKLRNAEEEAESYLSSLQENMEKCGEAVGVATERVLNLEQELTDLATFEQEAKKQGDEYHDWRLLNDAFGRDGIQALEIDAAGPEVAELTNHLLEACYGSRFSISLETIRRSADGKKDIEDFGIRAYDGGHQRNVEDLSGGEKVIVGEALNLSLAILNSKRSGIGWETLWRDETAGALDPTNASAYVRMLRRARELGHFRQVIYVAHLPEVVEGADSVVRFPGGGRIEA